MLRRAAAGVHGWHWARRVPPLIWRFRWTVKDCCRNSLSVKFTCLSWLQVRIKIMTSVYTEAKERNSAIFLLMGYNWVTILQWRSSTKSHVGSRFHELKFSYSYKKSFHFYVLSTSRQIQLQLNIKFILILSMNPKDITRLSCTVWLLAQGRYVNLPTWRMQAEMQAPISWLAHVVLTTPWNKRTMQRSEFFNCWCWTLNSTRSLLPQSPRGWWNSVYTQKRPYERLVTQQTECAISVNITSYLNYICKCV